VENILQNKGRNLGAQPSLGRWSRLSRPHWANDLHGLPKSLECPKLLN